MFMDEHVFPGADASCPMGWVLTKLEQAGFEVQNVYNLGNHYSRTLFHWLQTWEAKKETIVKAYGERRGVGGACFWHGRFVRPAAAAVPFSSSRPPRVVTRKRGLQFRIGSPLVFSSCRHIHHVGLVEDQKPSTEEFGYPQSSRPWLGL